MVRSEAQYQYDCRVRSLASSLTNGISQAQRKPFASSGLWRLLQRPNMKVRLVVLGRHKDMPRNVKMSDFCER